MLVASQIKGIKVAISLIFWNPIP